MNKVMMVLTSHDWFGNTGRETGFWLEEFAAPYYLFKDAGVVITVASRWSSGAASLVDEGVGHTKVSTIPMCNSGHFRWSTYCAPDHGVPLAVFRRR
jgi:putative intracellular protease/amidase